jgi:hypothetical protein
MIEDNIDIVSVEAIGRAVLIVATEATDCEPMIDVLPSPETARYVRKRPPPQPCPGRAETDEVTYADPGAGSAVELRQSRGGREQGAAQFWHQFSVDGELVC